MEAGLQALHNMLLGLGLHSLLAAAIAVLHLWTETAPRTLQVGSVLEDHTHSAVRMFLSCHLATGLLAPGDCKRATELLELAKPARQAPSKAQRRFGEIWDIAWPVLQSLPFELSYVYSAVSPMHMTCSCMCRRCAECMAQA